MASWDAYGWLVLVVLPHGGRSKSEKGQKRFFNGITSLARCRLPPRPARDSLAGRISKYLPGITLHPALSE
jgi:hypothetical protein